MRSRRTALALACSLALHLALIAALVWSGRKAPAPAPTVMRITLRPAPARSPAIPPPAASTSKDAVRPQRPGPATSPPSHAKRPPAKAAPLTPPSALALRPAMPERLAPQPAPSAPEPIASPPAHAEANPRGAPDAPERGTGEPAPDASGAPAADVADTALGKRLSTPQGSRAARLFPGIAGTGAFGTASGDPEQRGHTIHNDDPSELPDPAAVAAVDGERVKARVDGWIENDAAGSRVRGGAYDSYFSDLGRSLQKQAEHPPDFKTQPNFAKELVNSYVASVEKYGRTGNPYGEGMLPEASAEGEQETPMQREARMRPGSQSEAMQQKLDQGARLREFADGRFGNGLLAVVELRQASDGKLTGAALIQPSGNRMFDQFVLRIAPDAVTPLPPPPAQGAGIHPDGLRSTWAFRGRITFKRKLKDLDPLRDGWYLALTAPLGMTGDFDVATGDGSFVDLRNPQFACTVKLLRVY